MVVENGELANQKVGIGLWQTKSKMDFGIGKLNRKRLRTPALNVSHLKRRCVRQSKNGTGAL